MCLSPFRTQEAIGYTGSTHLLEHLMFKGSSNFNKANGKSIWDLLQTAGCQINATTWFDRTNYFELAPIEALETCAAIEADRMRGAFIREEDRQTEMTVVRNEFERGENDPVQALEKAIWATAFQAHPYHHSTIGWRSDIENVPIERLQAFYREYYHPSNAVVTIIGDVTVESALALVDKHFGPIPPSPKAIPPMYTAEPPQEGPRRIVIKRPGQNPVVGIAHKTPHALSPDSYPLIVLARALGSGKTARLYKRLVDTAICTRIAADNDAFRDAGLFTVYAFLTASANPEEVEKQILEELENVRQNGITADELARAKSQIRAQNAFARDGTYSMASKINEAIAAGDWKYYTELPAKIEAVTLEDVQRVARRYLDEDWRTTGYFIPRMKKDESVGLSDSEKIPEIPSTAQPRSDSLALEAINGETASGLEAGTRLADRIVELNPVEGCRLFVLKTPVKDVIKIQGSLLGGEHFGKPMVAHLFSRMLAEGTKTRSKFEIGEMLENKGASLTFSGESDSFRIMFSGRALKEDLGMVIGLLGEMLRETRLDPADFEQMKKRVETELNKRKENTSFMASQRLYQQLYPPDHPNYSRPIDEEIEALKAMTVGDLVDFQIKLGLGDFIIATVGDVDADIISSAVQLSLGGFKRSDFKIEAPRIKAFPAKAEEIIVNMPGKTSANVAFGQPIGISRDDPKFYPLYLASFILGGNFSARLMQTVRDRDGLTYGIGSSINGIDDGLDGTFMVMATFAPSMIERGIASTMEQLQLWASQGVTDEECAAKKQTVTGTYRVRLATCDGLAGAIVTNAQRGKPLSFLDGETLFVFRCPCKSHKNVGRVSFHNQRDCTGRNTPRYRHDSGGQVDNGQGRKHLAARFRCKVVITFFSFLSVRFPHNSKSAPCFKNSSPSHNSPSNHARAPIPGLATQYSQRKRAHSRTCLDSSLR